MLYEENGKKLMTVAKTANTSTEVKKNCVIHRKRYECPVAIFKDFFL